jgi:hypothetical protein
MSLPDWVIDSESRKLYAKARALSAGDDIVIFKDMTEEFIATKSGILFFFSCFLF